MARKFTGRHTSRRSFIKGTLSIGTAVAGASALAGCKRDDDIAWNEETDIIIVGAGGAGMTAAIEAIRADAEVILLEKGEETGGTTSLSGGVIQGSGTAVQASLAVADNTDSHFDFYTQAGEGVPDPDLLHTLVDNSADAVDFMIDLGLNYASVYPVGPIPTVDAELHVDRIHEPDEAIEGGRGVAHAKVLRDKLDELGADVRTEATVEALIEDLEHGIIGVEVSLAGTIRNIRARKGVVLASGGMDWNTELARAFSPQQLWELETGVCLCNPENTGDGLIMAMDVGADVAGMGGTIGYPALRIGRSLPGIWINRYGQRFVNEEAHYAWVMRAVYAQEAHLAWALFDQNVADLGGGVIGGWSEDLSDEVANGTIIKADTRAELAAALDINVAELERTVTAWNAEVPNGADPVFGRTVGLDALNTGPFYAVQSTSINLGTCGGLRIDSEARVVDLAGAPIARLFAAGMVAGGFIGPYYPGSGTAILSTVVFGRIAGANAAALDALEPVKKLVEE